MASISNSYLHMFIPKEIFAPIPRKLRITYSTNGCDMKTVIALSLNFIVASIVYASPVKEVFCLHDQCQSLSIPADIKKYVIDEHRKVEDKINAKYLKDAKTESEGLAAWQQIQKGPEFQELAAAATQAGEGMQKILMDYKLEKIPAFVCHRSLNGSNQVGVVYGGTYLSAIQLCTQWIRGAE